MWDSDSHTQEKRDGGDSLVILSQFLLILAEDFLNDEVTKTLVVCLVGYMW